MGAPLRGEETGQTAGVQLRTRADVLRAGGRMFWKPSRGRFSRRRQPGSALQSVWPSRQEGVTARGRFYNGPGERLPPETGFRVKQPRGGEASCLFPRDEPGTLGPREPAALRPRGLGASPGTTCHRPLRDGAFVLSFSPCQRPGLGFREIREQRVRRKEFVFLRWKSFIPDPVISVYLRV